MPEHDALPVGYLLARVDLLLVAVALALVTQLLLVLLNELVDLINGLVKFVYQLQLLVSSATRRSHGFLLIVFAALLCYFVKLLDQSLFPHVVGHLLSHLDTEKRLLELGLGALQGIRASRKHLEPQVCHTVG